MVLDMLRPLEVGSEHIMHYETGFEDGPQKTERPILSSWVQLKRPLLMPSAGKTHQKKRWV